MIVLGIDPGATTGWCLYDSAARRVLDCGQFAEHHIDQALLDRAAGMGAVPVIESMYKVHGKIFPAVVLAAITEGRLLERVGAMLGDVRRMLRHDVKLALTAATHRTVVVTNDKTAWQALVLLHGDGCDVRPTKKRAAGSIGMVASHERAALAVAVAWVLQNG